MAHAVTLIPGDYTGPEVAASVKKIVECAGVQIAWEDQFLGDRQIPSTVLASLQKNKVGLLAYHYDWHRHDIAPPIVKLRKALGMFANVRPIKSVRGIPSRHDDIDLVIVREVTEDIYAHLEHESIPGVYESLKVTTKAACERIARYAFETARQLGRKKVTIVHKANIMKKSDGMFLRTAREVATEFPDIQADDVIVDALCMKLVLTPAKFDVLVAGNLYGDIVADLCAGLAGGASNCPSINVGPDIRVFANPHGDSAEHLVPNHGNPLGLLLPAVAMLRHLGESDAADRIWRATEDTLGSGVKPFAIGGAASTSQFTAAVCERL